jgi:uncharacterized protein (TIGR03118 family)
VVINHLNLNKMKTTIQKKINCLKKYLTIPFIGMLILMTSTGCDNNDDNNNNNNNSYKQTNLVADASGYNATRIDTNLKNPWGIAIGPTGAFWISAAETGLTTIYDRTGAQLLPAVSLNAGGAPTGVVYNSSATSFGGNKFIYAGEDGVISGWSSGTATTIVADRSANGAVYKGIAIASDGGADFLYAANFKGNDIDVFDSNFNYVTTKPFDDPTIPAGFAPFNIYNHDGKLYVTYAKQLAPDNEDDQSGAGNGYVNIFNADGTLSSRFASQGTLNSPWGLVDAPTGFGVGTDMILVGNFGDGRINIFDANGTYKGQLMDGGTAISIEGLWALQFPEDGIPAGDQNQLFFTAGPADETHGIFGYLSKR